MNEYPEEDKAGEKICRASVRDLFQIIKKVEYAAEKKSKTRPYLNCIHLFIEFGWLIAGATDGFRIALESMPMECMDDFTSRGFEAPELMKLMRRLVKSKTPYIELRLSEDGEEKMFFGEESIRVATKWNGCSRLDDIGAFNWKGPTCEVNTKHLISVIGRRRKDDWIRIVATAPSDPAPAWISLVEKKIKKVNGVPVGAFYPETLAVVAPVLRFAPEKDCYADVNVWMFLDALRRAGDLDNKAFLSIDGRRGIMLRGEGVHVITPLQKMSM